MVRRTLVTGGCGFIGRYAVQEQLSPNDNVRIPDVLIGRRIGRRRSIWRHGDQRHFIADPSKLERQLGWRAGIQWRAGVQHLAQWLSSERFQGRELAPARRRVQA